MKAHLTLEFDSNAELAAFTARMASDTADVTVAAATESPVDPNSVDADGMPYDAAVHSDPPQHTADSRWRAKRGKAEAAAAARAAFLAKGGTVQPPADVETRAAVAAPVTAPAVAAPVTAPAVAAPVTAPAVAAPTAPAMPPSMPEPVTLERLYGEITARLNDQSLTGDVLNALYQKHTGHTTSEDVSAVLAVNETARAALLADLPRPVAA